MTLTYRIYLAIRDGHADTSPDAARQRVQDAATPHGVDRLGDAVAGH